jgi:hypothetical protein
MELCLGGDLFSRIENQTSITERSAAVIFRQLVEIVEYCHSMGVLHRWGTCVRGWPAWVGCAGGGVSGRELFGKARQRAW